MADADSAKLATSIDAIERWMARVEYAILAFGALLTVGVVAEVSSHATIWAILVAIGVAGEVTLGIVHAVLAARLRVLSAREKQLTELEIARLSATAADATARALEASAKLAWREISPAQRDTLVERLKPFAGQPVEIVLAVLEGEPSQFASNLVYLFQDADWEVRGPSPNFIVVADEAVRRSYAVWNGILIDSNFAGRGAWPDRPEEEQRLLDVMYELHEALRGQGFETLVLGAPPSIGPAVPRDGDTSLIRLHVCRKWF